MTISIPPAVLRCLAALEAAGYSANIVGGCVRDSLMGRVPHDWDVCTCALPDEVARVFEAGRIIPTGIKHGTLTLLDGDMSIEITTLRRDGDYLDHRRPVGVSFTGDLREDLARRDFTVNAMAFHPERGLCDPFGGEGDIGARVLRCVGEPERRFSEDALRILRLFRFASQLSFAPHEETLAAAGRCVKLLGAVSSERVAAELDRLLVGQNVYESLRLAAKSGVLGEILPEFIPAFDFDQRTPYHNRKLDDHIFYAIAAAPADLTVRLALLFHDLGKPDVFYTDETGRGHFKGHVCPSALYARAIMQRLRYPARLSARVELLVAEHNRKIPVVPKAMRRLASAFGTDFIFELINLKEADDRAKTPIKNTRALRYARAREILDKIIAGGDCLTLEHLAVGGNDLIALGIPSGPALGKALDNLLDLVLDEPDRNTREFLLAQAKLEAGAP